VRIQEDPFAETFRTTEAAAAGGDVAARVALGELLRAAKGSEHDETRASALFHVAAQDGNARAAYLLAVLIIERGKLGRYAPEEMQLAPLAPGIEDDPMVWLTQAADAGLPEAQLALADYLQRDGGSKDDSIAWAQRAADQGYARASLFLGVRLPKSEPLRQRRRSALSVAAETYPIAELALYQDGDRGFPAQYRTAGAATALPDRVRRSAFAIDLEEAANRSPPDAPGLTAHPFIMMMLVAGTVTGPLADATLKRELRRRAGEGDVQSACNLAYLTIAPTFQGDADAADADYAEALPLYRAAAERGAARAQYRLGKLYRDGRGTPVDKSAAARWFYRSAMQDYLAAQAALGEMLLAGDGIPKNEAVALAWLRPAAALGHPVAQFHLGRMYYDGIVVPPDRARGLHRIRRAAANDFGHAARDWLTAQGFDLPGIVYWGPGPDTGRGSCGERPFN
jgi:TPR repeat protein